MHLENAQSTSLVSTSNRLHSKQLPKYSRRWGILTQHQHPRRTHDSVARESNSCIKQHTRQQTDCPRRSRTLERLSTMEARTSTGAPSSPPSRLAQLESQVSPLHHAPFDTLISFLRFSFLCAAFFLRHDPARVACSLPPRKVRNRSLVSHLWH